MNLLELDMCFLFGFYGMKMAKHGLSGKKNVLRWPHLINIHVRGKSIAEWVAVLNLLKLSVVIWNANIMCILAKKSVEAPPSCINLNKNLRMDWNKN